MLVGAALVPPPPPPPPEPEPAPAPAPGPELMGALQQLLDSWPQKNHPYYIDLANVVAQFMG